MKRFGVIDCETAPFKHNRGDVDPFIWGYSDENGFRTFAETENLVQFLKTQERIIYAHNGGRFDYHFLLKYLNTEQEITEINGRVASARLGNCELRDSYCLFPSALRDYRKDEIDYTKFERDVRGAHMPEIISYLEGDCFYLGELITEFRETYGNHLTLASAALSYWAKHFNGGVKPKIGARETQARWYHDFTPWYFGGRVARPEPRILTDCKVSTWDINSAYPAAMLQEHPCGPIACAGATGDKGMEQRFYTVRARSEGFFCEKTREGNTYPADGEYRTFNITGWELKQALELGAKIQKITKIVEFPNRISFGGYVSHFHKLKEQAPKGSGARAWAKIFLNGLYGKWSANPENYSRTFHVDADNAHNFAAKVKGAVSGSCYSRMVVTAPLLPEQIRYYDVVVGASITGNVRAKLMKAIRENDAHYWDTDNIHKMGDTFIGEAGKGLGMWAPEFKADSAVYYAPKGYGLHNSSLGDIPEAYKFASKGMHLPTKTAADCRRSWEIVARIAAGETYRAEKDAPTFNMRGGVSYIARNIRAIRR